MERNFDSIIEVVPNVREPVLEVGETGTAVLVTVGSAALTAWSSMREGDIADISSVFGKRVFAGL